MISIDEALKIIRDNVPPGQSEEVRTDEALGRVSAADVRALRPSPAYTNSAMDGFAVIWDDVRLTAEDNPVSLAVIGESSAGKPFSGEVRAGQAVRISTGAMLPPGADMVVPVEQCRIEQDQLTVLQAGRPGQHVRYEGEEFKKGDVLLSAGSELTPGALALLASVGQKSVTVYRRPRVAILVTGSELVPYNQTALPHQLHDSNSIMLSAAVREAGGQVTAVYRVEDDLGATITALQQAEEQAGLIILTGGVSVGPHDHVKPAAARAGYQTLFWKIRQKPGKPFFLAKKDSHLLFGLPGNPVSAFMGFAHYIRPLIRHLQGREFIHPKTRALLATEVINKQERSQLLRVKLQKDNLSRLTATPLTRQGSHMLTSVATAGGYIIIPEKGRFAAGQSVDVYLFSGESNYGTY